MEPGNFNVASTGETLFTVPAVYYSQFQPRVSNQGLLQQRRRPSPPPRSHRRLYLNLLLPPCQWRGGSKQNGARRATLS